MQILKDLYLIFAELSVAFAGFVGIVAAFSTFHAPREVVALRVRFLVVVAMSVLIGSILPFVLIALGTAEHAAIRVSALAVGVGIALICVWSWRIFGPLQRAGLVKTQVASSLLYTVSGAVIFGYSIVVAGRLADQAAAIYLGGLFFGIIMCCWYFILLMFAIDIGKRS